MFCRKKRKKKTDEDCYAVHKNKRKRKISFLGKVALSIPIAAAGINILAKIKGAGDENSGHTDREKENDYNDNIKHDKFFDDDEFEAM